jgi:Fic family protein
MATNKFNKRLANLPASVWSKIGEIKGLQGQWVSGANLSPQVLGRLKKFVLSSSTGASTRIEGAKLSDEDVKKLMRGIGLQKFSDRDKGEVKGYYELLSIVFENWKSIRFSESTVKHFHKELLKYVEKDERHRGDYKKGENKVVMTDEKGRVIATVFNPTPAYLAPKEMLELVEWTIKEFKENKIEPLLVIANFIVEFLNIHPFQDGNGRSSRILTNLLLLQAGYLYMPYVSHEKLVEDNKTEYYIALRRSQTTFKSKKQNIIPWLEFFFEIFLQQSRIAISLLNKENVEKLLSPMQLKVWEYMQTVEEATPRQISENTEVYRPTINQVLDKLLEQKLIERIGQGSATRYRKI